MNEPLPFRVDILASGGWQHLASFAGGTDAYEYGGRHFHSRVWDGDECIVLAHGRLTWHAPQHLRNCDGKPCECGQVPPIGSHAVGG